MEFEKLSIKELVDLIKTGKCSAVEVMKYFLKRVEKFSGFNAIIGVFENALEKAKRIDEKVHAKEPLGKLAGVPIVIKDNIMFQGKKVTCASKFMQDFVAPYSATIVKKIENEDGIIFARTNMDEFAMGGSCEKSCYGATLNAFDKSLVAGGSSGGSAVAVALGLCMCGIGTDTGGSIRQPSSFNGVVGIKPTYGTISRYGVVAFASSTDQAGPITRNIEDNEFMLSVLSGKDVNDQTSISSDLGNSLIKSSYKIGICKEIFEKIKNLKQYKYFEETINKLKNHGMEIVEVSVPHILNSLACYYILTPAEATSNLSRFDGVKYAKRSDNAKTLEDVYVMSRSEGFGDEVKRRIILGNYVLSSGYFDSYYGKAKKLQKLLKSEFASAFDSCDCILTPTTPDVAFKVGEKVLDPVSMYLEDLFTVPASIAGIPALNVPYAVNESGLPFGLQLMGKNKSEFVLYDIAKYVYKEQNYVWCCNRSWNSCWTQN